MASGTETGGVNRQRLEKLNRLYERGVNPYPHRYQCTHNTEQAITLLEKMEAEPEPVEQGENEISIAGRIMSQRPMGKVTFLDLRDGTGKIQLYCCRDVLNEESNILLKKNLDIGDIVGVRGKPFRTRSGEASIEVKEITMLAKSLQPLPEKWHGLSDIDTRYRQRYLDLISNTEAREIFSRRSRIITAIRDYLEEKGFIEVETPVLQSLAGGALAQPFVTHHHALGLDMYLRIALELYLKRLVVGGFDRVYELGRIFRNEGVSTKHNPEFTMLETYQAYADYTDVMKMLEEMVYRVCHRILGKDTVAFGGKNICFQYPWQRIELRQAIKDTAGIDFMDYRDADTLRAKMVDMGMQVDSGKDRGRLIDELISSFVEPDLVQPSFLMHHPVDMSPLAKTTPDDENVVERFEAFAGGIEIANAFTELNDPFEQRKRFIEQQKGRQAGGDIDGAVDEDYLRALEHGMPPTGGLGVGIDRLVMLLTGQTSIRQVILFPQLKAK